MTHILKLYARVIYLLSDLLVDNIDIASGFVTPRNHAIGKLVQDVQLGISTDKQLLKLLFSFYRVVVWHVNVAIFPGRKPLASDIQTLSLSRSTAPQSEPSRAAS